MTIARRIVSSIFAVTILLAPFLDAEARSRKPIVFYSVAQSANHQLEIISKSYKLQEFRAAAADTFELEVEQASPQSALEFKSALHTLISNLERALQEQASASASLSAEERTIEDASQGNPQRPSEDYLDRAFGESQRRPNWTVDCAMSLLAPQTGLVKCWLSDK